MATLTNEQLPFQIDFVVTNNFNGKINRDPKTVTRFNTENIDFVLKIGIKELEDLSLHFYSKTNNLDNNAILYMDGLEMIDSLEEDNDGRAFLPINNEVNLYYQQENDMGYPWLPGIYTITVHWENNIYYSQILIESRHLTINELDEIKIDLEKHARGLAREWLRKNRQLSLTNKSFPIDSTNLDIAKRCIKESNLINSNLDFICNNPLYDLEKVYSISPISKVRKIDATSYKWLQSSDGFKENSISINKPNHLLSPNTKETLDIPENQWIRKIILEIIKVIDKSIIEISNLLQYTQNELIELEKFNRQNKIGTNQKILLRNKQKLDLLDTQDKINTLKNQLYFKLNNSFLKSLNFPKSNNIPMRLTRYPRYQMFYTLYKEFFISGQEKVNDLYQYTWKSSEVLYEYWCFIQIIEILRNIGLEPVDGWIYSSSNSNEISIPSIPDDTQITFLKENIKVVLIFNSPLERFGDSALKNNALYWIRSRHNKPDFRLDIYRNNEFHYTLILDAKYRPADRVWNKSKANISNPDKTTVQLKEYVNYITKIENDMYRVTKQVFALCPGPLKNGDLIDPDIYHSVTLVQMKPKIYNHKLEEKFSSYIFEMPMI